MQMFYIVFPRIPNQIAPNCTSSGHQTPPSPAALPVIEGGGGAGTQGAGVGHVASLRCWRKMQRIDGAVPLSWNVMLDGNKHAAPWHCQAN